MNIVLAPDSFKESLGALAVARALERGLRRVLPNATYTIVPVADGGEGTVAALLHGCGGRRRRRTVTGPSGTPVRASYAVLHDGGAVMEMAAASGLGHVPVAARNPLETSTFGSGELLRDVLQRGVRDCIIGVGGSATVDGGAGMAQALGIRFLDARGRELGAGLAGGGLGRVAAIDVAGRLPELRGARIRVACDVSNPLLGRHGAAAVYGPQKGATPADVSALEDNLAHLARLIRRDLGVRVDSLRGGGAAGGLAAGLVAFVGADLCPGAELVCERVGLAARLRDADLVITGEGRVDRQTAYGKAPAVVARYAQAAGIPVVVVGGSLGADAAVSFAGAVGALESATASPMTLDQALQSAPRHLRLTGERIGHWLELGRQLYATHNPDSPR